MIIILPLLCCCTIMTLTSFNDDHKLDVEMSRYGSLVEFNNYEIQSLANLLGAGFDYV